MRQQDTTGHINPAQLKLGHISPARQPKALTVLGESNKTNNGEEKKRDGSVDKPQRNRSGKASQVVQHLHIQQRSMAIGTTKDVGLVVQSHLLILSIL